MKIVAIFFLVLLAFPIHAQAGPLEDAKTALEKGDYSTAVKLLQPLAKDGNAEAQVGLGEMYLSGNGVEKKDVAQGLEWINKAAAQGNSEAEAFLGHVYETGYCVPKDYNEALKWLHKAADQGDSRAQDMMGEMYAAGHGVDKDEAEAQKWFKMARRPPRLPAELVKVLETATSVTLYSLQPWGGPDLPEWNFHSHHVLGHVDLHDARARSAIAALNDAISTGDGNSESMCLITPRHALRIVDAGHTYDIVICYQCHQLELLKDNNSIPFSGMIGGSPAALNELLGEAHIPLADNAEALEASNSEEAREAMERASKGDIQAEEALGKMYLSGHGVKKDKAEGVKWIIKSTGSSADDPAAEMKIADLFRGNLYTGMDMDRAEAFNWYRKAAVQSNARAQYEVGYAYEIGEGVKKDKTESLKWLQTSADQGNAEAQYEIGVSDRDDAKPNYVEALKWLRKAAEQGHANAAYQIASMYERGDGVAKDLQEAYFWHRLAEEEGTNYGGRISIQLTSEQFSSVDKRLQDWRKQHPQEIPNPSK